MTDFSQTIELKAGESGNVELESASGSGAIWRLASDDLTALNWHEEREAGGAPGSPLIQRFVFSFDEPGSHQLQFELKRPWEAQVRAHRMAEVRVSSDR